MQRLGKNVGKYLGDTIDIQQILRDMETAASAARLEIRDLLRIKRIKIVCPDASRSNTQHATRNAFTSPPASTATNPPARSPHLRLLQENQWPENLDLWFCPCLNPLGFAANTRENAPRHRFESRIPQPPRRRNQSPHHLARTTAAILTSASSCTKTGNRTAFISTNKTPTAAAHSPNR